ncbi:hypothetical protein C8J56DRAFT_1140486 [Mycena floridula]|nr:hypothetical protein C8J56DRAFT_1140486 [Mycena floridula]
MLQFCGSTDTLCHQILSTYILPYIEMGHNNDLTTPSMIILQPIENVLPRADLSTTRLASSGPIRTQRSRTRLTPGNVLAGRFASTPQIHDNRPSDGTVNPCDLDIRVTLRKYRVNKPVILPPVEPSLEDLIKTHPELEDIPTENMLVPGPVQMILLQKMFPLLHKRHFVAALCDRDSGHCPLSCGNIIKTNEAYIIAHLAAFHASKPNAPGPDKKPVTVEACRAEIKPFLFRCGWCGSGSTTCRGDVLAKHFKRCTGLMELVTSKKTVEYIIQRQFDPDSASFNKTLAESVFEYKSRAVRGERLEVYVATNEMKAVAWKYGHDSQVLLDETFGLLCDKWLLLFIIMGINEHGYGAPLAFLFFSAPSRNRYTAAGCSTDLLEKLIGAWRDTVEKFADNRKFLPKVASTDTRMKAWSFASSFSR